MPAADLKATIKVEVLKELPEKEHFDLEEKLENMISKLTEAFDRSFGGISNEKEIGRNTIAISEEIRKLTECLMRVRDKEGDETIGNKKTPQEVREQGELGNGSPKLTVTITLDKELWEEKKNRINSLARELRKELDTIPEVFKIKC